MGGVRDALSIVTDLAKAIVKAETATIAGRLNALGTVTGFAIVLGSGVGDVAQVIVRTWDHSYTTGMPSPVAMFAIWTGLFLVCVLIVSLVPPKR